MISIIYKKKKKKENKLITLIVFLIIVYDFQGHFERKLIKLYYFDENMFFRTPESLYTGS